MIKRAIITSFLAVLFAVVTSATWAAIIAGPQIIQAVQGAVVAHAKANRR